MKTYKTSFYTGRLSLDPASPGKVGGYAVLWDVPDQDGDIFRKGSFSKSVREQIAKGWPMMQKHALHGGDTEDQLGTITEAVEDDTGLKFLGVYAETAKAQENRLLALGGHIKGASVGCLILQRARIPGGGRIITEARLDEITLSSFPRQSNLPALKAAGPASTPEGRKLDAATLEGRRADVRRLQSFLTRRV